MRRTYKPLFWRATRLVNATDCMIEGRYCLKRNIIDIFILNFIKYFHSFIRVARQNNGLYVLRMIVKLAYSKGPKFVVETTYGSNHFGKKPRVFS